MNNQEIFILIILPLLFLFMLTYKPKDTKKEEEEKDKDENEENESELFYYSHDDIYYECKKVNDCKEIDKEDIPDDTEITYTESDNNNNNHSEKSILEKVIHEAVKSHPSMTIPNALKNISSFFKS